MPAPATPASKDSTKPAMSSSPAAAEAPQAPAAPLVDVSKAQACYANFCRVTGTPEELIIDFALNSQPFGASNEPIDASQRLVLNYYTAKRLLHALHLTLQRHEAAFGVLETDVQKRVQPMARQ